MSEVTDVRILKSKRDLRNGLFELLEEKPFEKITVNDICKRAMINRMTFYKHYADKYALFDDCLQSIALDIYMRSQAHTATNNEEAVTLFTRLMGDVLDECVARKKAILALVYGNNTFTWSIVKTSIEKLVENLIVAFADKTRRPKYPVKGIAAFITGGFTNIILEWLENTNVYPKEDLLADCRRFFTDLFSSQILFDN